MNKPTYQTISVDVTADAAGGLADGQPRQVVAPNRAIAQILIRSISPISQRINLHFGASTDPMQVYQGEVFGEDHVGAPFDAGLWYSYNGAPAAGTVVEFTIFYSAGAAAAA